MVCFEVRLKKVIHACPTCGVNTFNTNGTQTSKVKHAGVTDLNIIIYIVKYRFICQTCSTTFSQPSPTSTTRKRVSNQLIRRIMKLALNERNTFRSIGNEVNLSTTAVINIFVEHVPRPKVSLSTILSIDEIYLGKKSRKKYAVILMDFKSKKIIDMVYGRSVDECIRVLDNYSREERATVEYITCDMYTGFHRLASSYFPNARVCVDSFHVIQLINDALLKLITTLQKDYSTDSKEYYLLKQHKFLILSSSSNIEWTIRNFDKKLKYYISNKAKLDLIFEFCPLIQNCYKIKERYLEFNTMRFTKEDRDLKIRNELTELISIFKKSKYRGYKNVGSTLSRNYEYIINSFTRINNLRLSNGPIEARNAKLKMLLKTSGGYRNFDNFKLRALYVMNSEK